MEVIWAPCPESQKDWKAESQIYLGKASLEPVWMINCRAERGRPVRQLLK